MSEEKIIPGSSPQKDSSGGVLSGEGGTAQPGAQPKSILTTQKERLASATEAGGLQQIPDDFDEEHGDWSLIKSMNPFEILYLDYNQYKFITPAITANNYALLEKFWKNKIALMNTGGNRIAFKNKYGDGTIENSLQKLKRAYDKLSSADGIAQYFTEINEERLRKGADNLKDSIEHMMLDGTADKLEIQLCLERGLRYDLTKDETAVIIKRSLDSGNFLPYGNITGNSLLEQVLSVSQWMTKEKRDEYEKLQKERDSLKIQILPGKYASTIEGIGLILFEDAENAKDIIRENLLNQVIAQKDMVIAREIAAISKKANEDIDWTFLAIVYKLNRALPYRLSSQKIAVTVKELCAQIFENLENIKLGKEHLKKGYIETWLKESDITSYNEFIKIRDTSENAHIAFVRFLYTFNPDLPYRFAGKYLINTTQQLCAEVDKNGDNWEAGKSELFDASITSWLSTTSQKNIPEQWNKVKDQFKSSKDLGLEYFLHLLSDKLPFTKLSVGQAAVSYPKIQSGQVVETTLVFKNETRGYLEAGVQFSKVIPGVSLSDEKISIKNPAGTANSSIKLTINSNELLKGVNYETGIVVTTFEQQKIEIPVSFKIVFPKNAFLLQIAKYAGMVAAFFVIVRLLLSSSYGSFLNQQFGSFLEWQLALDRPATFAVFGWTFLIFVAGISFGIYFLTKYLKKYGKPKNGA